MRSIVKTEEITVAMVVCAQYQYDDITPEEPHHYEWRGIVASGETRQDAKKNLGHKIARSREL